jgi:hypothetical protein
MTWLAGNNATLSKQTATPYEGSKYLRVAYNGTSNPFAYQKPLESDIMYTVTGVARSDGTSIPKIIMTNKSAPVWTGDTSTSWQEFSFTVLSKGSAFLLWVELAGSGYAEFDAIYVKKTASLMTKNTIDSHGGTRHLRVLSDTVIQDGDMEDLNPPIESPGKGVWLLTQPDHGADQPDASLIASYRMFDNGDTNVANVAAKQYLIDGDMEKRTDVIVDGQMEQAGVTAWSVGNSATLTKSTASPYSGAQALRVAYNGTATPYAYQAILVATKVYKIFGWARGDGTYAPIIYDGFAALWTGTSSTTWQYFEIDRTATTTDLKFASAASASGWAEFDSVVVIDQAASVTDWTAVNSALLTKEVTNPQSGSQALRMTYNGSTSPGAEQSILTIGKTYRVKGFMRSSGVMTVRVANFGTALWNGTASTSWQPFDITFKAVSSWMRFQGIGSSGYTEADSIHVSEIPELLDGDMERAETLLTDGDCEDSGVTAWPTLGGGVASKQTTFPYAGTRLLRITASAGAGAQTPRAYQNATTVGKTYRIQGYVRSDGTEIPKIANSSSHIIWTGTASTNWQYFNETFEASTNALFVRFDVNNPVGTEYAEFDDLELTLDDNYLADGDCENTGGTAGVDAWTVGNNATLTKQTGTPYEGAQVLRVAYNGTSNPHAAQSVLKSGLTYRLKGVARSDGTYIPRILTSFGTTLFLGTTSTSWQPFDVTFSVSGNYDLFFRANATGAGYCEFDALELTPGYTSLLLDSDMDANGTTHWLTGNNATLSKESLYPYEGYQSLRVTYNGTSSPYARQSPLIAGVKYRITGAFRGDGTYTASVKHSSTNIVTSTTSTTWQTFDEVFTASGGQLRLYSDSTAAGWAEFDNIVLTPVGEVMNWVPTSNAVLSKQLGRRDAGVGFTGLRVASAAPTSTEYAEQDILISGQYYRVTGWVRSDGSGVPKVRLGTGVVFTGTTSTNWQYFDEVRPATGGTTLGIGVSGTVIDDHCEYDDVTISPVLAGAFATNSGADSIETEIGPALDFNGSADYVDAGTGFNSVTDVTVEFWVRPDDVTSDQWVLNKYLSTSDGWGVRIVAGTLKVFDDIGNVDTNRYSTAVSIDTLYHVVAQLTAALENKLYVNGSLIGSGEFSGAHWNSFAGNLYAGSRSSVDGYMDGTIEGAVNIYQEEKSSAWVTARYNAGLAAINSYVKKSTTSPRGQLRSLVCGQNTASQKKLIVGETYNVTASAKSDNGTNIPVLRNGATAVWTGTSSTSWQDATANFEATSELLTLDSGQWDNVVVTRVLGNDVAPAAERDQIVSQQYYLTGWYRTDGVSKFRIMDGSTLAHELAAAGDWTLFAKTWLTTNDRLKLSIDKLSGFLELDDLTLAYGDGTLP